MLVGLLLFYYIHCMGHLQHDSGGVCWRFCSRGGKNNNKSREKQRGSWLSQPVQSEKYLAPDISMQITENWFKRWGKMRVADALMIKHFKNSVCWFENENEDDRFLRVAILLTGFMMNNYTEWPGQSCCYTRLARSSSHVMVMICELSILRTLIVPPRVQQYL